MSQDLPLITVYITNYNYAAYLEQSIESVINQTSKNFELLIIDDGSTDNSREIIERYAHLPYVKTLFQKNKGLNITNNIAMRSAVGKYIMRLDADDFLEPDALATMSGMLEADNALGLVFPDYYYVNAEGVRVGEEKRHNFESEVSLYDQPAHGACTMIRLSFLRALGGYNESFTCQDGYDLWIKFVTHHKVTNVSRSLFSYRKHGNNLTGDEDRILTTRKKIKELFVQQYKQAPKALIVIPVRNTFIGGINWPLHAILGKTILERKIETCLRSEKASAIVISSSDEEILNYSLNKFSHVERVHILARPRAFSSLNETLSNTILQALEHVESKQVSVEAVMSLALEFPFVTPDVIDDAINTLVLFKSDSVLSVRPDHHIYYQHTGHSLKPILNQDQFTKLEREALYKGAGGIVVATADSFRKTLKLITGRVSHIVVSEKNAFSVFSDFDLKMAELAISQYGSD